jgi:hypothetical protein
MRVQTNHPDSTNHSGLQREQNEIALQSSKRPRNLRTESVALASPYQNAIELHHTAPYSSYSFQNTGPYHQAILAYQSSARFEASRTMPLNTEGNFFGEKARESETDLINILQQNPTNSAALYDLGLLYSGRGNRDKVSAVYQMLQKLDATYAEQFSTQLGLHEKMLLDIA